MKFRYAFVVLWLGVFSGCSHHRVEPSKFAHLPPDVREMLEFLDNAEEFELASLDPFTDYHLHSSTKEYGGWGVLGRTQIEDREMRTKLIDALLLGIEEKGKEFKCFEPRHGIRAVRDGKIVTLLICFACGHIYLHPGIDEHISTSGSPSKLFNKTLTDAGIPLGKSDSER